MVEILPTESNSRKKTILFWTMLVLIVLTTRINAWVRSPIITRDGVGYIQWAQISRTDPQQLLNAYHQEPLYPLLLSAGEKAFRLFDLDDIRRWEYAGIMLGTIFSMIAVVGIYLIAAQAFNKNIGMLAALLTAIIPKLTDISSNVMTESVFLGFLVLCAALFLRSLQPGFVATWILPVAASLLGLAAFFTRRDALIVLPILYVFLFLPGLRVSIKKRAAILALFSATIAVSLWIYTAHIGQLQWITAFFEMLSKNFHGDLALMIQRPPTEHLSVDLTRTNIVLAKTLTEWQDYLWEPLHRWIKLCPLPVALAAMAYPLVRNHYQTRRIILLLYAMIGGFLAVVYVHGWIMHFFVGRYLLPAAVFAMPLAAAVLAILYHQTRNYLNHSQLSTIHRQALTGGLVVFFLGTSFFYSYLPAANRNTEIFEAVRWIEEHTPPDFRLLTNENRVGFYSRRPWQIIENDYTPRAFAHALDVGLDHCYLVLHSRKGRDDFVSAWQTGLLEHQQISLEPVKTFSSDRFELTLLRFTTIDSSSPDRHSSN